MKDVPLGIFEKRIHFDENVPDEKEGTFKNNPYASEYLHKGVK